MALWWLPTPTKASIPAPWPPRLPAPSIWAPASPVSWGSPLLKYISLEFDDLNVVLAPFGGELMLALVGRPYALICEYRLVTEHLTAPAGAAPRPADGPEHRRDPLMEDAVEQLENLARSVVACTRCEELLACRLRAVPGGGHPHCAVMVVLLSPAVADEQDGRPSGSALRDDLAEFMPALTGAGAHDAHATTLVKCVPRTGCEPRPPMETELDNCFPFLSKELTITTPHYVLSVGQETSRYLLRRLFKDLPYTNGDSLELRLFDNPSFKIVPVATPDELRQRDARTVKEVP